MRAYVCACLTMAGLLLGAGVRTAAAQDEGNVEISGGYNFLAAKGSDDDEFENFPGGWYADVAFNVTSTVAVVGSVSGNYKTFEEEDFDLKIHPYMGGIRVSGRATPTFVPFGQFLLGGVDLRASDDVERESSQHFGFLLGGGVNVMATSSVGVRGQIDYLRIQSSDDSEILEGSANGYRIAVGVVLAF
jgi:opacity protein-like surface antigen